MMAGRGFGPQPTKIDKIVEQVVRGCQKRSPEALDQIFDSLPVGLTVTEHKRLSEQVLNDAVAALQEDIDTLSWLCGYFASEINTSEDNAQSFHPITALSKLLIKVGMQPFEDFMPHLGCRLVIVNNEKFQVLPEQVRLAFHTMQSSPQQFQQMSEAMLEELVVG